MSLRGSPLEQQATTPDGRVLQQDGEARELLREVVSGPESGELAPTAGALEPLADRVRR